MMILKFVGVQKETKLLKMYTLIIFNFFGTCSVAKFVNSIEIRNSTSKVCSIVNIDCYYRSVQLISKSNVLFISKKRMDVLFKALVTISYNFFPIF